MWIFPPFNSDFMRTQVNAMGTGQRQSLKAFSKMIMTIKNDADSGMRMMMTMPTMIIIFDVCFWNEYFVFQGSSYMIMHNLCILFYSQQISQIFSPSNSSISFSKKILKYCTLQRKTALPFLYQRTALNGLIQMPQSNRSNMSTDGAVNTLLDDYLFP